MKPIRFCLCASILMLLPSGLFSQEYARVPVQEMKDLFYNHVGKTSPSQAEIEPFLALHSNMDGENNSLILKTTSPADISREDAAEKITNGSFRGTTEEILAPHFYLGTWVSPVRFTCTTGIDGKAKVSYIKSAGNFLKQLGAINHAYRICNDGRLLSVATIDGKWMSHAGETAYGLELYLNSNWHKMEVSTANEYHPFSVLVYAKEDGSTDMEVLLPKELNKTEQAYATSLKGIIQKLPKNALGNLWDAKGRIFPGRYLKCLLLPAGVWSISDYIY